MLCLGEKRVGYNRIAYIITPFFVCNRVLGKNRGVDEMVNRQNGQIWKKIGV